MTELLDKFIYVYQNVKADAEELKTDLRQFIKANTGELIDFRTVKGKKVLTYVRKYLINVS